LYVVEVRHPVEVPGDERQHMTQWLTKRLGYQQRVPDLSSIGLKLVGARLLPGPDGAAASFYMYEGPNGERYTLYSSKVSANDTSLRFRQGKTLAAYYWVDGKVGYAVSGSNDRDKLETVTKSIYDQMERSGRRRAPLPTGHRRTRVQPSACPSIGSSGDPAPFPEKNWIRPCAGMNGLG